MKSSCPPSVNHRIYVERRYINRFPDENTGRYVIYEETPGWKHLVIPDSDRWEYYGTEIFMDWLIQCCYQL